MAGLPERSANMVLPQRNDERRAAGSIRVLDVIGWMVVLASVAFVAYLVISVFFSVA